MFAYSLYILFCLRLNTFNFLFSIKIESVDKIFTFKEKIKSSQSTSWAEDKKDLVYKSKFNIDKRMIFKGEGGENTP